MSRILTFKDVMPHRNPQHTSHGNPYHAFPFAPRPFDPRLGEHIARDPDIFGERAFVTKKRRKSGKRKQRRTSRRSGAKKGIYVCTVGPRGSPKKGTCRRVHPKRKRRT